MFAYEVDAARSARDIRCIQIAGFEGFDYELRRASHSITPPKTSIEMPQYRFTFANSSGARYAVARPVIPTSSPTRVKKIPIGIRRSDISPEDQIQRNKRHDHDDRERRGAFVPRQMGVVRDVGQPVD